MNNWQEWVVGVLIVLWSAKPCTAVRIRQEPHKTLSDDL